MKKKLIIASGVLIVSAFTIVLTYIYSIYNPFRTVAILFFQLLLFGLELLLFMFFSLSKSRWLLITQSILAGIVFLLMMRELVF
jgi:hypothetical protein